MQRLFSWRAPGLLAACVAAAGAGAAPVGDALDRPALLTRHAPHAVLLGAAHAGSRVAAVGERGIVVLSDDAGTRWRQAAAPVSVTLTAVRFADATTGMAVGHGATVLTSGDAGQTWARRTDGRRLAQIALDAATADGPPAALKDAQRLVAEGADKPLLDLVLFDAKRALVVGAYGLAFTTQDGGASWASVMARLDNPTGAHLYAVRSLGDAVLVVGEQGLVRHSTDGGRSFRRVELPYKGSYFTAELLSGSEWLVAGLRGNVWRTSDAGATWAQLPAGMPASITASTRRADGTVLLVNQAGVLLALRGDALVPLATPPLPPLNGVLALTGGDTLALGIHGAVRVPASTDVPAAAAGASK